MTDQLTDQRGFDKSPRELWAEWQKTKFPDADIRASIYSAKQHSGTDYANEPYAQSAAQLALAMIQYNRMIDARIERARRTWGMK